VRIIAENVANADSTAITPGGDPYRRQTVQFKNELDRTTGITKVSVSKVGKDKSDFGLRYDPGNPGANAQGYVKLPNVKTMIEMMDLKQAQRSFEANVNVIDTSKSMMQRTIDLLRP
jgi:flagellar basal-body rod protein FlgC